ncbi:MAG: DUF4139 domain-containing protein, partial [Campylobacteraceae bacterium]|nr:DUF4139 domain-containing protein [Campylobacteraceae bacterium]
PVSIGYIIPAPVWKAAYRLDLSGKNPFLQGWAIVDNAGDSDWKDVELSLVVGRLVSFTQPLYAPYFQKRPVLPLSIAGVAQARNYDAGFKESEIFYEMAAAPRQKMFAADSIADTNYDMTSSKSAGEHFVFTLKNPISLERRQSAMFPFVQGDLKARKISIFTHIQQGITANPAIGAEITNTLGLKLPAGAISVYDGGSYAGDALIDFLADGEKRFVSYGDDLTVKGIVTHSSKAVFDSIKISKGVISITEKVIYEKAYAIKNSDKADKNIILEHPIMGGAKLIEPSKYAEKTASSYRFEFSVGAGKELKYGVKEEKPNISSTRIADMDYSALTLFSTNQNFSKPVKDALAKAVKLMSDVSVQKEKLSKARLSLQDKSSEQDRIRKNIDAVGKESAVGKDYIKKLTALDDEIVKAYRQISLAELSAYEAEGAFKDYIANLEI